MDLKKVISDYLRNAADNIEANSCSMSEEEILKLASALMHQEMNKTEASEFLNMSIRQFDRKVESGEIPKGIHKAGSKQKLWYKDELFQLIK